MDAIPLVALVIGVVLVLALVVSMVVAGVQTSRTKKGVE